MSCWLPFHKHCFRCGGQLEVLYDNSVRGIFITRFWNFRCGWCQSQGMLTLMPPPHFSGPPPMPGE